MQTFRLVSSKPFVIPFNTSSVLEKKDFNIISASQKKKGFFMKKNVALTHISFAVLK